MKDSHQTPGVLFVGFDGDVVAVETRLPEVRQAVRAEFNAMLVEFPGRVAGRVDIRRSENEQYVVTSGGSEPVACTSIEGVQKAVKEFVIDCYVRDRPDLLWFHAGGVEFGGRALMIPGVWGKGKSTVTTKLCGRGALYMSDDVVPVDPETGRAYSFPVTPAVRENPGKPLPRQEVAALDKREIHMTSRQLAAKSQALRGILFPEFEYGREVSIESCRPADAVGRLLDSVVNSRGVGPDAFDQLCEIVESVPVYILHHGGNLDALERVVEQYQVESAI